MVTQAHPAPAVRPAPTGQRTGLWSWLSTVDHKRIGILYLITTFGFFVAGGAFALVMRLQLEHANNNLISPETYNQIMTMHGTTMVFLFVVPAAAGFGNYIVPLQLGARDMAFPRLNALSYWLLLFGGMVMYSSFLWTGAADAGWTAYPPLSVQSPGHGMDMWIVGLHLLSISSVIGAINFICTIHNMRAPGMRLSRMPLFSWTIEVYSIMVLGALPVLSGGLTMLLLDRNYGTNFFAPAHQGPILWQHLFWFFGHPEVYIVALPGFGMISEILPVFSRKPLFGYRAMVYSVAAIAFLGFLVWGHHMFAVGFGQPLQIWFMLASMSIAVPTGIKIFNWIGTMWLGSLRFEPPMLFAVGFIPLFMIGGLSGIMLAIYPIDQQVTDSYFVVAHFHYVMGSVPVFAYIGGLHYWFPKMTGRMLDRALAIRSFWVLFIGFNMTFFPMHGMGLSKMPRRIATYTNSDWTIYNQIATLGSLILAIGVMMVVWNVLKSARYGRVAGNDPWGANNLEWYTTSPPPPHNFDDLPPIRSERPLHDLRRERAAAAAVPAGARAR
jgi:cytochrome c oxidase subunit I